MACFYSVSNGLHYFFILLCGSETIVTFFLEGNSIKNSHKIISKQVTHNWEKLSVSFPSEHLSLQEETFFVLVFVLSHYNLTASKQFLPRYILNLCLQVLW